MPTAYPDIGLVVPALPNPYAAPITPNQRALSSDLQGPKQFRSSQREYVATQTLQMFLDRDQALAFHTFWKDTLVLGGLWFIASDWPTPTSELMLRRFLGAPKWDHVYNGAWRVAFEVELAPYGNLVVTSRPYPIGLTETMDASANAQSMVFKFWPTEAMDASVQPTAGELRLGLQTYSNWPFEGMDPVVVPTAGELRLGLQTYSNWPFEAVDVGQAQPTTGTLRVALVTYSNWPAEGLDVGTVSLISGTLV